ncbi:unnamed protein product [Paramecium pentaurelia]|uniref:Uncharacterized protein n=1 Tax=Paramecium pentaurelia TaxID=43138 RepID=A0A8S1XCL0_9CILI|nr:unnamed protein product [Paramecium pentaurelia]
MKISFLYCTIRMKYTKIDIAFNHEINRNIKEKAEIIVQYFQAEELSQECVFKLLAIESQTTIQIKIKIDLKDVKINIQNINLYLGNITNFFF